MPPEEKTDTKMVPVGAGALAPPRETFTMVPATLSEAMQFSKLIAASEMCPKEFVGKPQNVLIAIQMGAELMIPPMQSLQNIAVINGRPTMWGDLVLALARKSSLFESIKERDPQECWAEKEGRCEVRRKGESEPIIRTFTYDMAETAGLIRRAKGKFGDGPWITYPGRMLQMRARSWALRDAFADVLKGLQVREEVEDLPPGPPPILMPERATVASVEEVEDFIGTGKTLPPSSRTTPPGPARAPAPRKEAPPKTGEDASEEGKWTGVIAKVEKGSDYGEGKDKKTLYRVFGLDGQKFGTYEPVHVKIAKELHHTGEESWIVWKLTSRKNQVIQAIGPTAKGGEEQGSLL